MKILPILVFFWQCLVILKYFNHEIQATGFMYDLGKKFARDKEIYSFEMVIQVIKLWKEKFILFLI